MGIYRHNKSLHPLASSINVQNRWIFFLSFLRPLNCWVYFKISFFYNWTIRDKEKKLRKKKHFQRSIKVAQIDWGQKRFFISVNEAFFMTNSWEQRWKSYGTDDGFALGFSSFSLLPPEKLSLSLALVKMPSLMFNNFSSAVFIGTLDRMVGKLAIVQW